MVKVPSRVIHRIFKSLELQSLGREMVSSKVAVLSKLKDHMEELRKFGVKKIGLFGSYARDEQNEGSDIDLVVEFREGEATLDNFLGLAEYLERLLGRRVDLITAEGIRHIRIAHVRKEIERSVIYVQEG